MMKSFKETLKILSVGFQNDFDGNFGELQDKVRKSL